MASAHPTTTHTSTHRCATTIRIDSSDEYFSSQEESPRNVTLGPSRIWRSLESPEVQQPVPERPQIRPARRGVAFPKDDSKIPYINEHDQAAIAAWFEHNLPPLLHEWDQPVQPEPMPPSNQRDEGAVPPYWICMAEELPQSRPRHPEARDSLPFAPMNEPNSIPFPTSMPHQFDPWPEDPDTNNEESNSDNGGLEDPDPFADPVANRRDSDPLNPQGGDYKWPELTDTDRAILSPHRTATWELRQQDFDTRAGWPHTQYPRVHMDYYLATERGDEPVG